MADKHNWLKLLQELEEAGHQVLNGSGSQSEPIGRFTLRTSFRLSSTSEFELPFQAVLQRHCESNRSAECKITRRRSRVDSLPQKTVIVPASRLVNVPLTETMIALLFTEVESGHQESRSEHKLPAQRGPGLRNCDSEHEAGTSELESESVEDQLAAIVHTMQYSASKLTPTELAYLRQHSALLNRDDQFLLEGVLENDLERKKRRPREYIEQLEYELVTGSLASSKTVASKKLSRIGVTPHMVAHQRRRVEAMLDTISRLELSIDYIVPFTSDVPASEIEAIHAAYLTSAFLQHGIDEAVKTAEVFEVQPKAMIALARWAFLHNFIACDHRPCASMTLDEITRRLCEVLTERSVWSQAAALDAANAATDVVHRRRVESGRWNLVVRVDPPVAEAKSWTCTLCCAALDDESVVFALEGENAAKFEGTQRERLIDAAHAERDRVAEIWAPLQRIEHPATECDVTVDEVIALYSEASARLDAEGVSVQARSDLISDIRKAVRRKCSVTESVPRKLGMLKKDSILRFQTDVALDGEVLTDDELQQLASVREPLVKIRGKWVYIDPEVTGELRKLVQEVRDYSVRDVTEAEAAGKLLTAELQDAAGVEKFGTDIEIQAADLRNIIERFKASNPAVVQRPAGLADDVKLRPYQEVGLNWLAMIGELGIGGCLADDMGLGKTLQTLTWLQYRREHGILEPALLVCPTSVISNWEKEARRFTPKLRVFRQHGPDRPDTDLKFFARARKESTDLVITSFATMSRDLELFQSVSWKWSAVILDEAQNIKNPDTEQSRAARQLSAHGMTRLALTGTPVENGSRDLWALMDFLNPGMLGGWREYVRNVAQPIEQGKDKDHIPTLRRKIQPFILRRKKTDPGIADELPDKIERIEWCSLTREQAGWYQASLNNMEAALRSRDRRERQGAILKVLQELKQVCNGVAPLQKDRSEIERRSGKISRLFSLLESIVGAGEKAIVFSQYPGQFDSLQKQLMDHLNETTGTPVGVLSLVGSKHNIKDRESIQQQFSENDRMGVLLISLRAGGTGLNLQAANHVIHLDRWWNAAVEDQATDRAWRIGQIKQVVAHKFVCRGTLEERIDALIARKRGLAEDLLGDANEASVNAALAGLEADALLDVLRLDEDEAVSDGD